MAFKGQPQPYTYVPQFLSPSTICSRIRDAVRGALALGHPLSPPLTPDLLADWWSTVVVRYTSTEVIIGPAEAQTGAPLEVPQAVGPKVYEQLAADELNAICLLLSRGVLEGPFIVSSFPPNFTPPTHPNLSITQRPDGIYLL